MIRTTRTIARRIPWMAALAIACAAGPCAGQPMPPAPPPDWGHDCVTIGEPGNRPATELEAPRWETEFLGPLGAVDYTYRITRTEVTNAQYHRFITRYVQTRGLPFSPGAGLGRGLHITGFDPGGVPIIEIGEGRENTPVEVSILFAAA